MKIANIVYDENLVNHKELDFINYYNNNFNGIDLNLPTLFVGWKFLKERIQIIDTSNINILEHKIVENNLYWEFSFKESKSSHVNGISSFVKNIPNFYFISKYKYINLDPVYFQITNTQDLFDVLPEKIDKHYLLKDRMLYILSDDKIFGLDLDMYRFFKFNVDSIKGKLFEKTFNHVNDPDGDYYQKFYKLFPEFPFLKRYLVVLVSI